MFSICYMLIEGDYTRGEAKELAELHKGYLPDPIGKYNLII